MLEKFLKEVISLIVGKQNEGVVDLLNNEKYVNEFLIAKKLNITINQARNILYKISDYGLVTSIRKKDKKKGWYTYFWRIESLKALEYLRESYLKKIEQIENQVKSREAKEFYVCERCNIEFSEENALLRNFTCEECGSVFAVKDNSKLIKEFNKHVEKTKKDLLLLETQIQKEKERIDKKKSRAIKKEKDKNSRKKIAEKMLKKKIIKNKPLKKVKSKKKK
jgi:transcription factor E